ncbi:hypothetical protein [Methylobacterium oxalidis]|uniref:Uncharacterized protein n=1 Tax=Methylobacterium oxalidis TaxID=944322 RepID=A0A512JCW8_9HYPH|nr:hypothetical protein [Methylobacterium oxalidis]GEP07775.1 hypothetical protein MOX02_58130 [Methylobacterium oxalidis]GJE31127.1 hypothetical protein LDDCCGHA_1302 [Methylobacterium oxalidis]GLS64392.1 hypothetical protein GCM10007888_27730 [Methylobacterium oxalidis]
MTYTGLSASDDPDTSCPVPLEMLGRIYRADAEAVAEHIAPIPERTRARLAVYLYGRSHTFALGVRIAASCEASTLRRVAGPIGDALYDLSRQPSTVPSYGNPRSIASKRISLGGPQLQA